MAQQQRGVSGAPFTREETATLLAALRYYQQQGMGDPFNRPSEIHDIAADNLHVTSLDANDIDALCEKVNFL